jgi:hypothetical protein
MDGKSIQEIASQKFVDEIAKKFSDIEALLTIPPFGKLSKIDEARELAHDSWKELVSKHGANPAP